MWTDIAWVGIGGAAGALTRFAIARASAGALLAGIPAATLVANVAGCLAFGLLVGWWGRAGASDGLRLGLLVGYLGSLTTFSTFAAETVRMGTGTGLLNALAHNGLGLLAVWIGLRLATWFGRG